MCPTASSQLRGVTMLAARSPKPDYKALYEEEKQQRVELEKQVEKLTTDRSSSEWREGLRSSGRDGGLLEQGFFKFKKKLKSGAARARVYTGLPKGAVPASDGREPRARKRDKLAPPKLVAWLDRRAATADRLFSSSRNFFSSGKDEKATEGSGSKPRYYSGQFEGVDARGRTKEE